MDYLDLKLSHLFFISLSLLGFLARAILMMLGSKLIWNRWVRTLPHIVDTLLLISGIALALQIHQYPIQDSWLSAKLLALLAYIGFGFIALRLGKTRKQRILALIAALLCFAYMVAVALSKSAIPAGFIR